MKKIFLFQFFFAATLFSCNPPAGEKAQPFSMEEISRWTEQSKNVTVIRDEWGVPHIYGKSDADVVFGLMYAQCEDDFAAVEMNYIRGLGRSAEVIGENGLYSDLWARAFSDSAEMKKQFSELAPWLQKLMVAFADGMNFYLQTHPQVKPALLTRYEPWYPLCFSEGSSEGNLANQSDVGDDAIKKYMLESGEIAEIKVDRESPGSNAFAIAPARTQHGKALLFINPHVGIYYRTEVHLISEEGLNAYGAVSKGQFFVYHGFNQHCGWARTSAGTDTQDAFEETLVKKGDDWVYLYGDEERKVTSKNIELGVKNNSDSLIKKSFIVQYTHHGPVLAESNGKKLSITPLHQPAKELEQQWKAMKVANLKAFQEVQDIRSNSTNNTTYADDQGNIAFWGGNFVPKRNPDIDWSKPVKSDPANEWQGVHPVDETIHTYNPSSGWVQNCNSNPLVSAHENLSSNKFPAYMCAYGENARAVNATRLLASESAFTMEKLVNAGFDNYLSTADVLVPKLLNAKLSSKAIPDSVRNTVREPLQVMRDWDRRATVDAVGPVLLLEWVRQIYKQHTRFRGKSQLAYTMEPDPYFQNVISVFSGEDMITSFYSAVRNLQKEQGTWKVKCGDLYRFQKLVNSRSDHIDSNPSIPLRFMPGHLGSLPAAYYSSPEGQKRKYMEAGNSFIAVIEFGDSIKAKSIVSGGQSRDSTSRHFSDQAELFSNGKLKEVHFYKDDILKHAEKQYHPGE
jgi:acyl-homoserine lactone acylase PvdQ